MKISLRKQISLFFPLAEWQSIRQEAARRRIPMTELCREWMATGLQQLRQDYGLHPASPSDDSKAAKSSLPDG